MPRKPKDEKPKAPKAKKPTSAPAPVSLSRLRANPRRGGRGR